MQLTPIRRSSPPKLAIHGDPEGRRHRRRDRRVSNVHFEVQERGLTTFTEPPSSHFGISTTHSFMVWSDPTRMANVKDARTARAR